jgi:hypothetical protein
VSATERNVAAVRTMFEGYAEAWRTHRMPVPPRGLLVWALGAVAEIGGHVIVVEPHDVADGPFFLQIEADYYWAAIPDWRVTELDVAGSGDTVLSFAKFEGTGPDGKALEPIWLADRWHFNAAGEITRWQQMTDLAAWARWSALTGADYSEHITRAFAGTGQSPRFVP